MARGSTDPTILQMALVGYQAEKEKIELRIRELQAELRGQRLSATSLVKGRTRAKRILSEAARNRIAAAQRKRWAEHRKRQAAAQKS